MISLNFSKGTAPDSGRPLMKKAGVPVTPDGLAGLLGGLDHRGLVARVEALVELARVEAELLGVLP